MEKILNAIRNRNKALATVELKRISGLSLRESIHILEQYEQRDWRTISRVEAEAIASAFERSVKNDKRNKN